MDLLLQAIGLNERQESVYRTLLRISPATAAEIAKAADLSAVQVREALDMLQTKGMASRIPGRGARFVPAPPDVAVEALIRRRKEELEETRLSLPQLKREFRKLGSSGSPEELIEVIVGRDAVLQQFVQLQQSSSSEFLMFDKPPYVGFGVNELETELLRRGVRYRVLYDREALEVQPVEWLERMSAAGEEARVLPGLPMKLEVSDRRVATVPLNISEPGTEGAIVIHAPPLIEALVMLFETLWNQAVPLATVLGSPKRKSVQGELSPDERRLVALMASGLKDQAVARQLGVGIRTVHRRVGKLMRSIRAETRFQAGIQASRRGWISS